ncbi:phage tail tape measure protein [Algibacter sp. PT7-4]|uniref:phage tail tape measure protein n=1 Tax=Algibacter ulvanivorans TaxID=3400999 RepID=UPI003AB047D1
MAKDTKFNLTIKINGKEVANTLNGVGKEIRKLKGQLNKLNESDPEFQKKAQELQKARERYAEIKNEIDGTNVSLQEAKSDWDNLLSGFLSGNLAQAQEGLKGLVGNIKNITKAALAFIATPFGMAIAAIATIGAGVKKWVDYNLEIEKTNQLIRDLTQESGHAISVIRIRAEVLKKTFEVDVAKSVETAKSMVKNFGISYNEAFDIIEDGAIRGKLTNDEFLDSLKEYPIQFKNAGFSATDFANIVSTGIDLSIYSDKLPDAIKEFTLSITEGTDAAKEAMENAFGKKFTSKLFADIKSGAKTPKEALATIAEEASRIGLNAQQAQLLTADLFKGAGEDAGGALKIFEAVNTALNKQKKPLTEIQEIEKQKLEINKELKGVYTQLFASGSKGFNLWIEKGKLFASKTLLAILKGGVDVYNWFVDLNNESRVFSGILTGFGVAFSGSFKIIGSLLTLAKKEFGSLGTIIEGVFTLDLNKIKEGFASGVVNIAKSISKLKDQAKKDANEIANAFKGNNKAERVSLDNFLTDDTGSKTPEENTTNNLNPNSKNEDLTPEDKRIIDSKKKLKQFLDEWEEEQKIQKELEKFEKEAREEEEEILKLEAKLLKMEEEAGIIGLKEEELSNADKELKERLEQSKEEGIAAIRQKYAQKRQKDKDKADKEYEKKLKEHHKKLAQAEQDLEEAKARALRFGINTLQTIFGEKTGIYKVMFSLEKALAISEIINSTAKANALAKSTNAAVPWIIPPGVPNPAKPISVATMTKSILANKINAGVQIATIAASAIQGFKDGGPTGSNAIYHDQYGKVTGVVHDDEWVAPKIMTQNPRYASTLQWLEKERKKELGLFFDGGSTSKTTPPMFSEAPTINPENNQTNLAMIQLLQKLDAKLDEGFKGYMVRDYQEFLERKEQDKEHQQILSNTRS